MKINLPIAGLLLGVWLLPATGNTADASKSAVPPSANETASSTAPANRHATASQRSDHPIDDSVITTKIKTKLVKDSQTRADNIEIKTLNGEVELFGTARTRAKAAHAVTLARQVDGVKSVKNNIQIDPANAQMAHEKGHDVGNDRTADRRRSDHPVDDTWITTKIEAKFVKDKQVRARDIQVKTVNGAVELTGTARTRSEAARAVTLARQVKGVQSVKNDLQVAPAETMATRDRTNDRDRTADRRRSNQPVDDTWITTKVKAKLVEDKQVSAGNIHVKTVNGVVELTGTARSTDESSQAASLARDVEHVKSVKNHIRVN